VEVRNIKAHLLALSGDQEEAARVFVEARDLLDDSTMYELRMDLLRVGMEFLTDPALRLSVAEELVQLLTVHVRNVPDSIRSIIELRGIYEQEKTKAEVVRQQELTRTIVETQERSLREIGRDLHDSLGQDLTVVVRMADVVRKRCANADPETVDLLDAIHAASQRAASDARRISHLVSGSGVTASTLQSLLSDLVEVTRKAVPELDIECIVVGTVEDLADDVARTIYRATQTLVQNVIRHAKAHSCTVQVVVDSKQTTLIVEDDGVGLDVETTDRGLGLREVEARLALVGGWVRIDGAPGRGVEVHCIIPR
jgi:signal transduction histidine kinase